MAKLATGFETAQSNIEPSDDDLENAPGAHAEVNEVWAASVISDGGPS